MKTKHITILLVLIVGASLFFASDALATEGWVPFGGGKSFAPLEITVPTSTMEEIVVELKIPGMTVREVVERGVAYQRLAIPGSGYTRLVGKPQLPMVGRFIAIPSGSAVDVEVVDSAFKVLEGYMIYPAKKPLPDIKDAPIPPFVIDEGLYQRDEFYPREIARLEGPSIIRGCSVVILRVYPVQFNPVKKTLRVYSNIRIKVSFKGGGGYFIENRLRSSIFDKTFSRLLLNAPIMVNEMGARAAYDEGNSLLIITHPDFENAANTLAGWKVKKGIPTEVRTTDDIPASNPGNPTAEEIQTYIQDAYDNWNPPPTYILFIGDAEFIPCHYETWHPFNDDSSCNDCQGHVGTDLYYATVAGTDYFPDISIGRLSVDTLAQATKRVNDIIAYERASVFDDSFYTQAACVGYFQDNDPQDQVADRRFALTSEDIRNYLQNNGYAADRIYTVDNSNINPRYWSADYWPYEGLPLDQREIPTELQRPNFDWDGDEDDVSNAVNAGRFLVTHRDHGETGGWDQPSYNTTDVQALTNGNKLPVLWSINCQTGWFDNETDDPDPDTPADALYFSEAWERNFNGGAIGMIAGTRVTYSGHNDRLAWGWMDAIWPDFDSSYSPSDTPFDDPQFEMGQILNYGKFYYANFYEEGTDRQIEFEMFHWFGDPTMQIWTGVPQKLNVSHDTVIAAGATSFDVTMSESDALICISRNDEILGKSLSTGGTTTVSWTDPIHPCDVIKVTITKHNFRPYEGVAVCDEGCYDHWAVTYGAGNEFARSVQQTLDGGYIVAGASGSVNPAAFCLLKLNSDGSVAWEKTYIGPAPLNAWTIRQTEDGRYIIAGETSSSPQNVWVLKINPDGTIAWQKTYGMPLSDLVREMQQTTDGGYIMGGMSLDVSYDQDVWVLKINPDRTIAWQKTYGRSGSEFCNSIQQTLDGGYIVAGRDSPSHGIGAYDSWILKLNSDGTIAWQMIYGGSLNDWIHSIRQTQDGGYIVAGATASFGTGEDDF